MYHQFEHVEFKHAYLNCDGFEFRTYWQQIDAAYIKVTTSTVIEEEAGHIANDIGLLLGDATETWKSKEDYALNKVFDNDEQYVSSLSRQLSRLKTVVDTLILHVTSPRLTYTVTWLNEKTKLIRDKWRQELSEFRSNARHYAEIQ